MTDNDPIDHRTLDSLTALAREMTLAATSVAAMVGAFDDMLERQTRERVQAELLTIRADHEKVVANLEQTMLRSSQRAATQIDDLRLKIDALTTRYEREPQPRVIPTDATPGSCDVSA